MKFLLKADIEIELDDRWLQEMWEEDPVDDEEADALKFAVDTFKKALSLGQQVPPFDPIGIYVKDVARVN